MCILSISFVYDVQIIRTGRYSCVSWVNTIWILALRVSKCFVFHYRVTKESKSKVCQSQFHHNEQFVNKPSFTKLTLKLVVLVNFPHFSEKYAGKKIEKMTRPRGHTQVDLQWFLAFNQDISKRWTHRSRFEKQKKKKADSQAINGANEFWSVIQRKLMSLVLCVVRMMKWFSN